MKETRADTVQAAVLALGLHVLLFALAFLGIWWTRNSAPVSAAGAVIEAELISPDALSPAMQQVLRDRPEPVEPAPAEPSPEPVQREEIPPPQPVLEPIPQEIPEPQPVPQEQVPEPDTVEQDRASAQAIADREAAEREQEERRRQEQIDLTERKRQEEAERQRRTEMEEQRQEQLADIRRRKAAAAREAELAERKLEQLKAAREAARMDAEAASPPPGNAGPDASLLGRYQAALTEAVLRQWTRPDTVPLGQRCRIVIRQIPGGEVIQAEVDPSCPYDERGRRSIEAAVLKAQPLPYAGYESVFSRTLILNFEARDR